MHADRANPSFPDSPRRRARVALLCALFAGGLARAQAADYPSFRPGMWRLDTTLEVDGKQGTRQTTKCGDPTEGMRAMFASSGGPQGCTPSAPRQAGNRYSISTDCGTRGRSHVEVIVHSESSFTQVIDSRVGSSRVKEKIEARRLGACGK
ncbi:MAG TPA: DUF3617 family protein [Burkholderiales bacterium]|nr:DUF3617 family protein [Burkholderiales bacterium]